MNLERQVDCMIKIALDVDGVLADVIVSWLSYNNKIRPKLSKQDIVDWEFWNKYNISRFDFYDELNLCWKNWKDVPTTEKNLAATTKTLAEIGDVDIVTARSPETDSFVKKWLEYHDIAFENYVSVAEGEMKADLDYDLFIDDSPLNFMKFIEHDKNTILYSQPWNQNVSDAKRVSSLAEAVKKIKRFNSLHAF